MLLASLLFVCGIILVAFLLNSMLDRREERRLRGSAKKRQDEL